jgi:small subunit ribosomal protein S9
MAVQYYEGVGRRKASTARVRVMNGSGNFVINGKVLEEYFPRVGDKENIYKPLETTGENPEQLDVTVLVKGGGVTGQSDAVKLGLARALIKIPREKERKKPGLKRARKAPTYTKR